MNDNDYPYKDPFNKDVLDNNNPAQDPSPEQPLSEENFIQESPSPSRFPAWLWLFLITAAAAVLLGGANWYQNFLEKQISSRPFLEVTNRDFSVFLWQFPSFMRDNVKRKAGYLTGFLYGEQQTLDLSKADEFVTAPPDLVFLYHTWHRLLASDFIPRPIPVAEFLEFLNQVPEWQPKHWKQAPEAYVSWIPTLKPNTQADLKDVPQTTLPLVVRQAFQGWKNYYKEGPEINQLTATIQDVQEFLKQHPAYARNDWRNIGEIAGQQVAGLLYLEAFLNPSPAPDEKLPVNQLSSFLRVALFNDRQAKKDL